MTDATASLAGLRRFIAQEEERLASAPPDLPFTRAEYTARRRRLQDRMARERIDVLILTSPEAMCWLSGYRSRWYRAGASTAMPPCQCIVLTVGDDEPWMVETAFHEQLVRMTSCIDDVRTIPHTDLNHEPGLSEFVGCVIDNLRTERALGGVVGLELWSWVPSPAVAQALVAALEESGGKVVDASRPVRAERRLKSPAELALIERAQRCCDAGLLSLQRGARPGMTGLEGWQLFTAGVVEAGGEPSAMHETVFAGPPEPVAHLLSTRRPIEAHDYFHADACASFERYHARGTRVYTFGEPPDELARLTAITAGALEVLRDTGRAGIPFGELNRALFDYFMDAGLSEDEFFAGGYELGISFPPDWVGEFWWSAHDLDSEEIIPAGLVTNLESCAFVAVVDTVVFEPGRARTLSEVPADVLVVGG
jgi:Xaa-Pro aminopeptidase